MHLLCIACIGAAAAAHAAAARPGMHAMHPAPHTSPQKEANIPDPPLPPRRAALCQLLSPQCVLTQAVDEAWTGVVSEDQPTSLVPGAKVHFGQAAGAAPPTPQSAAPPPPREAEPGAPPAAAAPPDGSRARRSAPPMLKKRPSGNNPRHNKGEQAKLLAMTASGRITVCRTPRLRTSGRAPRTHARMHRAYHTHTHARTRTHAQHAHVSRQGAFESEEERQEHLWCELGGEALAPTLRSGAIKLLRAEWLVHPAPPRRCTRFPGHTPSW